MQYESLKDWKYRILKTFSIQTDMRPERTIRSTFSTLTTNGTLYIKRGFCWDGASGAVDTDTIMLASCCHDAGCNWYLNGLINDKLRSDFDDLFYELCSVETLGI